MPVLRAFLRPTPTRVRCFYAPCWRLAVVALCTVDGAEVAAYCPGHGRLALRQYGAALEQHLADAV